MVVVTVARKPLPSGETVALSVLRDGTGALDIDACRIGTSERLQGGSGGLLSNVRDEKVWGHHAGVDDNGFRQSPLGRWPANLVLGQQAAEALDQQAGHLVSGKPTGTKRGDKRDEDAYGDMNARFGGVPVTGYGDEGGASRFFKQVR